MDDLFYLYLVGDEKFISLERNDFRGRSLKHLVLSVPEGLQFLREGDNIRFIPNSFDGVPWYGDVGRIITHFYDELKEYMPQGRWALQIYSSDDLDKDE